MCDTHTTTQMPIGTPPILPSADGSPGTQIGSDLPSTVNVQTPTKFGRVLQAASLGAYDPTGGVDQGPQPTKFGRLMQFIAPVLTGGLVGLAGGKRHPEAGFGAANDYFAQRRSYQLQQTLLHRQLQNDAIRNALEMARTEHELNRPRFERIPPAIKGQDADGNPIIKTFSPETGQWEVQPDIFPADAKNHFTLAQGDQGEYSFNNSTGETSPVMVNDPNSPTTATVPYNPSASADNPGPVKQVPVQPKQIPLRPKGFSTPKPVVRASRDSAGNETDYLVDTNPNSPTFGQRAKTKNTRAPLPDRPGNRAADNKAQKVKDASDVEAYAAAALKQAGNDPEKAIDLLSGLKIADPQAQQRLQSLLPQIRKSIRDRRKPPARRRLNLSPQDQKDAGLSPSSQESMTGSDDEDENE